MIEISGLSDVLTDVFRGKNVMLTGKKFSQNLMAVRMFVEELLSGVFCRYSPKSYAELMKVLVDLSTRSKTVKLWVDMLIKPVLIIMKFV